MAKAEKICPECGHEFKGNGWDGIDAHWKAAHEGVMPYKEAWPIIQSGQYAAGKKWRAVKNAMSAHLDACPRLANQEISHDGEGDSFSVKNTLHPNMKEVYQETRFGVDMTFDSSKNQITAVYLGESQRKYFPLGNDTPEQITQKILNPVLSRRIRKP